MRGGVGEDRMGAARAKRAASEVGTVEAEKLTGRQELGGQSHGRAK